MKKLRSIFCVVCFMLVTLSAAASAYDVRDFGAKGDGVAIDSDAVNAAIIKAASDGGGTVFLPSGTYLCRSIRLASGICIKMERGSVIKAVEDGFDLAEPKPEPQYQDYGHSHFHNSLIWGENISNVRICGGGLIDGSALSGGYSGEPVTDGKANKAIALKNCRNVTLEGFTVYRGGHFALLATGVDKLRIKGVTVDTNRDGLDIDCCRDVRIAGCTVNAPWDDAIVLKASYALGYIRDTENVRIRRCRISSYLEGTLLDGTRISAEGQTSPFYGAPGTDMHGGRIKIGTESSGSFRHIRVRNCVLADCGGLILNSMDGGVIEDAVFSNIKMNRVFDCPIFLRLGDRMRSPEGMPVGSIRDVSFRNIKVRNAAGRWPMMVAGIPGHCIEDISFSGIDIEYEGGYRQEGAINPIPEKTKAYPDPWLFREYAPQTRRIHNQYLPFRSLMIRHARRITFRNIRFSFLKEDTRPDFYVEDAEEVKGIRF